MGKNIHTVTLDSENCRGCIACMKRCPTEAIRVRNGKAKVLYDRCIGCGECVRICPHQAKLPAYDPFNVIFDYKYKIAVPAPSLFGQFNNLEDVDLVLNGLLEIGFDDVYEVALGAELISAKTRELMALGALKKPIISSACPAVVELIHMRYKGLADHVVDLVAPVEVALRLARERAIKAGIPAEDIGVFFISPCPAKVYALKNSMTTDGPIADGVLAISEVYFKLLPVLPKIKEVKKISQTGMLGIRWAASGGECLGIDNDKYLAADGMENVINVLQEMENGSLSYIDFVELTACTSGCVGGVLNVENPFAARARLRSFRHKLEPMRNALKCDDYEEKFFHWDHAPEVKDIDKLGEDFASALKKMREIEELYSTLPHIDCGQCGAPSCRAFAEDVVNGDTKLEMCTRIQAMDELFASLPQTNCGKCGQRTCRQFARNVVFGDTVAEKCPYSKKNQK
ncbi:MAG: 4Fe-4S dicluster domain-containing protein [Clostridia bacterium]|nr:4Fe-4S dicluster domain-containing protein [Clostridia bacterium]